MQQLPPKIICTVTNDLSYDQRMIRICRSLVRQGFEVVLVGRELPTSRPLIVEVFAQKRLRCHFHRGKLFYLEFNVRLFWWLLRQSFDLVCAIDLDTLVPGFMASRWKGKICVYDAHEYFTELPEVVDRPITKWVWSRVAGFLIPRLRYAYTVGPKLAEIFEKQYGTSFTTIRNLPTRQEKQITVPEPGATKIILYQGRLNAGRGLETAVLAMRQLEGAQLWLAGEGDLSQLLRDLVSKEGLEDKVRFLGYLPPEQLQQITLQAYIGINLLENKGLSYYYSLANKAFDYIQAGLPSVQMDFPEYRVLQEQYGVFVLVETLEVALVVAALQKLLQDQEYWTERHQNCLAHRSKLCWEEEEQELRHFYQAILSP